MATCVNRPWVSVRRAYPRETHAARWFGTLVVGGSSRKGERMVTCYRVYRELRIFCLPTRWRERQARVPWTARRHRSQSQEPGFLGSVMNSISERVERRLRLGEDSRWEFMQVKFVDSVLDAPGQQDLADELAAFANGRGGFLLCGVTDDGRGTGNVQSTDGRSGSRPGRGVRFLGQTSYRRPHLAYGDRRHALGRRRSAAGATRSTTVRVGATAGPAVRSAG